MSAAVDHIGLVSDIKKGMITVRLVEDPSCHSCSMASLCHPNEEDRSLLKMESKDHFQVGEEVLVRLKDSTGLLASVLAYIVPFFLVIAVLTLLLVSGANEGLAAAGSLLVLVPYYSILAFYRNVLKKHIQLELHKR